jgi:tetratricopeptide (TPR) repeat protein
MTSLTRLSLFLTLLLIPAPAICVNQSGIADTSAINRMTREAYIISRQNAALSLEMGHRALRESREAEYEKGMADAALALGMAYFTLYNPGDSALFYSIKALESYKTLDDILGEARACYTLAYTFSFKGQMDESERYSRKSLELFRKAGDKRGMINASSALAYIARRKGDLEEARELVEGAIEISRTIKDTLSLADALNNLGNIYMEMALFSPAIENYFGALELWEAKGDSAGLSIAYGSIALMYLYQSDFGQALYYNLKKLALTEIQGNHWEESKTLNNISQIYNAQEKYDTSLVYLRRGLKLNRLMNYQEGVTGSCYNIAGTMLLSGQIDSAFYYINMAVGTGRETGDPNLASYLITLSKIQRSRQNYSGALGSAAEAYKLAEDQNQTIVVSRAAALLSDLYNLTGRKDLAFDYLREYTLISDSIANDEYLTKINRLELEHEYTRKEKAAEFERMQERLRHENRIRQKDLYIRGMILMIILLGIITFLYIRHSRIQALYARIDIEQKLLRAQMNPHFISNSLCAVQELINRGEPDRANLFIAKIARLMRNILENSTEEYISLEKEIETIRLYMDIQKLRFDSAFNYNIVLGEGLDPENLELPPMFAQPCIENSIEHGLKPLKGTGRLNISYTLNNGVMIVEIEDNGIGRSAARGTDRSSMEKVSVSTKLTAKRIEYFRETMRNRKISFDIADLYNGDEATGTKVVMKLPYRKIYQ